VQSNNKSKQEEGSSHKKAKIRHDLRTENDAPKKKSKEKGFFPSKTSRDLVTIP